MKKNVIFCEVKFDIDALGYRIDLQRNKNDNEKKCSRG